MCHKDKMRLWSYIFCILTKYLRNALKKSFCLLLLIVFIYVEIMHRAFTPDYFLSDGNVFLETKLTLNLFSVFKMLFESYLSNIKKRNKLHLIHILVLWKKSFLNNPNTMLQSRHFKVYNCHIEVCKWQNENINSLC